jgi:hypothetical protein
MSSLTVQSGPLRFSTKADLDQLRLKFRADADSFNTGLTSASVNGQSFSFNLGGVQYSREEYGDLLAAAYNQLGIYDYGTPSSTRRAASFC